MNMLNRFQQNIFNKPTAKEKAEESRRKKIASAWEAYNNLSLEEQEQYRLTNNARLGGGKK
jgi:hypothetical protein